MKIIKGIEQGTNAWLDARAGLISASNADVLLTPTGKTATGAKVDTFLNKMIAERIMGKSAESSFKSEAMQRGIELEDQARSWYEMATGADVVEVGLVKQNDYSCSPDGLIMDGDKITKGLEIKCPLAHTHVGYLRANRLPTAYIPQVQSSMFVCDVQEWDFMSYHPDIEPLLLTVKRDDEWIESFISVGEEFLFKMLDEIEVISKKPKNEKAA